MSILKIDFDVDGIAETFGALKLEVQQDLTAGVKRLAAQVHTLVIQHAQNELHTTRNTYLDCLHFEEISPTVWVISLDEPAMFIEEGLPTGFDMKPGLLKNAKISKKGIRYAIIPFDHSKPAQDRTVKANIVRDIISEGLKNSTPKKTPAGEPIEKRTINKIEKDSNGSPRIGTISANQNFGGPVMGRGNTPVGNGVNVYQKMNNQGKVDRSVMTYRTVTDDPSQMGKWHHPGLEAKRFLDKAFDEALLIWENEILPQILAYWKK